VKNYPSNPFVLNICLGRHFNSFFATSKQKRAMNKSLILNTSPTKNREYLWVDPILLRLSVLKEVLKREQSEEGTGTELFKSFARDAIRMVEFIALVYLIMVTTAIYFMQSFTIPNFGNK
jgi:hypothetical protein